MSAAHTPPLTAYSSAYPGSMSETEDGGYLRRDDASSLAAGLLALIASGDRAASDAQDALKERDAEVASLRAQNERLRDALQAAIPALRSYQYGNAATDLAEEVADKCRAALAAEQEPQT